MFNIHRWKINRLTKKIKSMQLNRVNNQPSDQLIKKEISTCFELAELYKKQIGKKKFPFAEIMVIECYKAASNLNDSAAHYQLGQLFLNEGKYRQNLQNEAVFSSEENQKRTLSAFDQAHAHLLAAEKLGHIEAKRLRGLAIINGWGQPADKNSGFELVVASIEQEGSWDRVPQIFAAMGLNKPEFFAAIMQKRKVV
ncbi:hypothetical protein [Legionella sp. km772]|uniref:hypothetical protein n=1 Tax=Legionella sp. km772 TaxID=2498111 RepID=UPI000F8F05C5|nr:hypothetical protein [Legionella sp. km772]RUR12210.1 hypothetical protein ELY15_05790 [Legionella sp. km772]